MPSQAIHSSLHSPAVIKLQMLGDDFEHQGPYSPTILENILCLFLQDFVHLNVTQLLIGYTVWFSQSEVVLHSNVAKDRKIWRIRQRTF